ncbi:transglycosylase [Brevundimonas vitis]|uniref:Transglycosylase n=1 Tax=Brevundimonas vitisensis TaxID=2800818 RepID=A0ABX7BNS8_9CAUL|nr:transglycosylase [Brevundimonas vitisensis]QQQ18902.1 transglycosylase [Brevundimonas vitisensis]
MQYLDILTGALGAFALAWIADQLTGRRGLFATSLVAGIGALCGWFLTVRVIGIASLDDWRWIPWSMAGSVICLVAFFLFRSKR